MASTGRTSIVSSARATPKSRRDTPTAVVLPKIGVHSTDNISAIPVEGSHLPQASPEQQPPQAPLALEGKVTTSYGLQSLAVQEFELDIGAPLKGEESVGFPSSKHKVIATQPHHKRHEKDFHLDRQITAHLHRMTWPSLQYKLWIDTSNLSLYRLNPENRIAQPYPKASRWQKGTENRAFEKVKLTERNNGGSLLKEDNNLTVGSRKWQVSSSQESPRQKIVDTIPRLPSRLGKNSFSHFMENSNSASLRLDVLSRVGPRVKTSATKKTQVDGEVISSSPHSTDLAMLRLKGQMRNPLLDKSYEKKTAVRNERLSKESQDKVKMKKKLSFAIPSTSGDGGSGQVRTDSNETHSAQAHFSGSFHVMKYISSKT